MIRHIIWDFNGTLLDDAWLCVEVLNTLMHRRGMPPINLDSYKREFGFPVIDYYKHLGFDFTRESFDDVSIEYISLYNARRHECSLQSGSVEALNEVEQKGLGQSVLSAYNQPYLEEAIGHYGIRSYFKHVLGLADNYASSKVENGKRLIRELGLEPMQALLVGDTNHDYEAARSMEIPCILVSLGHQSRERLSQCGVPVCGCFNDVLEFLRESTGNVRAAVS